MTRAGLESMVLSSIGRPWKEVGFSIVVDGTNQDLNAPIFWALSQCGINAVEPLSISDSDLASITNPSKLIAYTIYACLELCYDNYTRVDQTALTESKSLNQWRQGVGESLKRKAELLKAQYGFGKAKLTTGIIRVGFDSATRCRRYGEF